MGEPIRTDQIVEVIVDLGPMASPRYRTGSGLLVSGALVLTAGHNVAEREGCVTVRTTDGRYAATVLAAGSPRAPTDLAVLEIVDSGYSRRVAPVDFFAVDRSLLSRIAVCKAVGYPAFAESVDGDGRRRAESVHVVGAINVASDLKSSMLTLLVDSYDPRLDARVGGRSAWQGMSGAAVIAEDPELGEGVVGVVIEHDLRRGPASLSVVPITNLALAAGRIAGGLWPRFGVEDPAKLPRIPAPAPLRLRSHGTLVDAHLASTEDAVSSEASGEKEAPASRAAVSPSMRAPRTRRERWRRGGVALALTLTGSVGSAAATLLSPFAGGDAAGDSAVARPGPVVSPIASPRASLSATPAKARASGPARTRLQTVVAARGPSGGSLRPTSARPAPAAKAPGGEGEALPHGEEQYVTLVNNRSRLCLGIPRGDLRAGAEAVQWHCAASPTDAKDQFWWPDPVGNGYVRLKNLVDAAKCLSVAGTSRVKGVSLVIAVCAYRADQYWDRSGYGWAEKWRNANSGMVMGIPDGSPKPSTRIMQWPSGDLADQYWHVGVRHTLR